MKACSSCGAKFQDNAIACAYCGVGSFLQLDGVVSKNGIPPRTLVATSITVIAVALVVYLVFSAASTSKSASDPQHSALSDIPQSQTQPQEAAPQAIPAAPPVEELVFSGITVSPYQVMKDPFIDQGKLVRLDLGNLPIIVNGGLMQYVHQNGRVGLRLDRTLSSDRALYDVVGIDANGNGNLEEFGQLIVDYPNQSEAPAMNHYWFIVTEEPSEGTNGLGAPITVPTIKFVKLGPVLEFGGPASAN